ncbi:glycerol-3-phosphate acyltransferase [Chloroflexota bacterium]
MLINGIISVIIAYLLGSIPAAYIITRLATGKDIRKLGGGNVGARNVFREVGLGAGIAVAVFDIGKGIAAVTTAGLLLSAPLLFILIAGLAVVAGHIWSVFLKFSGGNGLATSLGVLSILMTKELLIALAITVPLIVITRNIILSVNISLLSIPISAWLLGKSVFFIVFPILLMLILVINFFPTARTALVKAESKENLFAELMREDRVRKKRKKAK